MRRSLSKGRGILAFDVMKNKNITVVLGDPRLPDPVKKDGRFNPEDLETVDIFKRALGLLDNYKVVYLDDHTRLLKDLRALSKRKSTGESPVDYVLNFCDEGLHNHPLKEQDIPQCLEKYGLPYTGAGPRCLRLCYDKSAVKKIASNQGIPVTRGFSLRENEDTIPELEFPVFIKPNYGDGSFAINNASVVNSHEELSKQIEWVREKLRQSKHRAVVLVEEYLPGEELSVAMIGNPPELEVRIIQENLDLLTEGPKIIGQDAKWDPDSEGWKKLVSIKPKIAEDLQHLIKDYSVSLFGTLECRDYARFDWRIDREGKPKLMEANPNCGWCHDGHLVRAFSLGSEANLEIKYSSVLEKILRAAEKRLKIY